MWQRAISRSYARQKPSLKHSVPVSLSVWGTLRLPQLVTAAADSGRSFLPRTNGEGTSPSSEPRWDIVMPMQSRARITARNLAANAVAARDLVVAYDRWVVLAPRGHRRVRGSVPISGKTGARRQWFRHRPSGGDTPPFPPTDQSTQVCANPARTEPGCSSHDLTRRPPSPVDDIPRWQKRLRRFNFDPGAWVDACPSRAPRCRGPQAANPGESRPAAKLAANDRRPVEQLRRETALPISFRRLRRAPATRARPLSATPPAHIARFDLPRR